MKNILIKYHPVPSIVSGLFIFILCFLPGSAFPDVSWAAAIAPDKWVHAILYFLWFLIYYFSGGKKFLTTAVIMVLFGGFIEMFQHYLLPSRSGEWLDWIADGVGLIAALLLKKFLEKSS